MKIICSLLIFLSLSINANEVSVNYVLKSTSLKNLVYKYLKTNNANLFSVTNAKKNITYTTKQVELDDNSKEIIAMLVEVKESVLLNISCSVKLFKLANLKWRVYQSTCQRTGEESELGIFYFYESEFVNQLDSPEFFGGPDNTFCYKGNINDVLEFAKSNTEDLFWVGDEYSIKEVKIKGSNLEVSILDDYSYDQTDSQDGIENYITKEYLSKCE